MVMLLWCEKQKTKQTAWAHVEGPTLIAYLNHLSNALVRGPTYRRPVPAAMCRRRASPQLRRLCIITCMHVFLFRKTSALSIFPTNQCVVNNERMGCVSALRLPT